MKWIFKSLILFIGLTLVSSSCENEVTHQPRTYTQEELLEANRKMMTNESKLIDAYIAKNDWEMEETSTGLRYDIYHNGHGIIPTTTMVATITYTAYLLDSTRVGSANISDPMHFRIGHDDVISGLHEGITLLSVGDSARFVIPSRLAYGLTGDNNIPSNAALFYDITLLEVQ